MMESINLAKALKYSDSFVSFSKILQISIAATTTIVFVLFILLNHRTLTPAFLENNFIVSIVIKGLLKLNSFLMKTSLLFSILKTVLLLIKVIFVDKHIELPVAKNSIIGMTACLFIFILSIYLYKKVSKDLKSLKKVGYALFTASILTYALNSVNIAQYCLFLSLAIVCTQYLLLKVVLKWRIIYVATINNELTTVNISKYLLNLIVILSAQKNLNTLYRVSNYIPIRVRGAVSSVLLSILPTSIRSVISDSTKLPKKPSNIQEGASPDSQSIAGSNTASFISSDLSNALGIVSQLTPVIIRSTTSLCISMDPEMKNMTANEKNSIDNEMQHMVDDFLNSFLNENEHFCSQQRCDEDKANSNQNASQTGACSAPESVILTIEENQELQDITWRTSTDLERKLASITLCIFKEDIYLNRMLEDMNELIRSTKDLYQELVLNSSSTEEIKILFDSDITFGNHYCNRIIGCINKRIEYLRKVLVIGKKYKKLQACPNAIKNLERKVGELLHDIDVCKTAYSKINGQLKSLNKKIQDSFGSNLD